MRACFTYTSQDVPKTIPYADGVRSTLTIPRNVTGVIESLRVIRLDMALNTNATQHVRPHLISPDSEVIAALFDWNCRGSSKLNMTLDDAGGAIPYCQESVQGTFKPDIQALSDFQGINAAGTWTMLIDVTLDAPGLAEAGDASTNSVAAQQQTSGQLNSWGLQVCLRNPDQ